MVKLFIEGLMNFYLSWLSYRTKTRTSLYPGLAVATSSVQLNTRSSPRMFCAFMPQNTIDNKLLSPRPTVILNIIADFCYLPLQITYIPLADLSFPLDSQLSIMSLSCSCILYECLMYHWKEESLYLLPNSIFFFNWCWRWNPGLCSHALPLKTLISLSMWRWHKVDILDTS